MILLLGAGGQNLKFNGDYKVYFEEDNTQRLAFERMQAIFSKNVIANVLIAPRQGCVFNPNSLKLVADITADAWQTPLSSRVDSIA